MSKDLFFFGTKGDILSIFYEAEKNLSLRYVESGLFEENNSLIYYSIDSIPGLGINTSGEAISKSYLVLSKKEELTVRDVLQRNGTMNYAIDQLENPDTTVFWPGGIYEDKYLIQGRLASISDSSRSKDLQKEITKIIKKKFKRINGAWFGDEARSLEKKVRFITISIHQPKEYDVTLN